MNDKLTCPGQPFAIVRPTARLVMSWSGANPGHAAGTSKEGPRRPDTAVLGGTITRLRPLGLLLGVMRFCGSACAGASR
jgi:hypothetical protein